MKRNKTTKILLMVVVLIYKPLDISTLSLKLQLFLISLVPLLRLLPQCLYCSFFFLLQFYALSADTQTHSTHSLCCDPAFTLSATRENELNLVVQLLFKACLVHQLLMITPISYLNKGQWLGLQSSPWLCVNSQISL